MKAVAIQGKGRIEIEKIPKPQPRAGMLLLKVIYCSICGSDVERLYSPLWDSASEVALSKMKGAIPGHEFVAKVEEVGEGVTGWAVGDRVVDVHVSCGHCFYCIRGMGELCMGGRVRGHPYDGTPSPDPNAHRYGAMTEYILRPAIRHLKVPDAVSSEEASMCEPLGTGVTAVHSAGVRLGDSAAVIGVGHIGLMVVAAAKAAGAAPVIAVDRNPLRLDVAAKMGADIILNPDDTDIVRTAVQITRAGPDIAFICVSSRARGVLEQAFELVRRKGRIILVGNPAPAALPTSTWLTKEVRIEGTVHMDEKMYPALKLLEYGRVNVKPAITEIVPLRDAQRAFESLRDQKNIAVLLAP